MTREEALRIIKDIREEMENARDKIAIEALDIAIEALQEPKQGEWIEEKEVGYYEIRCSKCNSRGDDRFLYCPWCGARMTPKASGEEDK